MIQIIGHKAFERSRRLPGDISDKARANALGKGCGILELAEIAPRQLAEGVFKCVRHHIRQRRQLLGAGVIGVGKGVPELAFLQAAEHISQKLLAAAGEVIAGRRQHAHAALLEYPESLLVHKARERAVVIDQVRGSLGKQLACHIYALLRKVSEDIGAGSRGDGASGGSGKARDRARYRAYQKRIGSGVEDLIKGIAPDDARDHRYRGARQRARRCRLCRHREQRRSSAARKDRQSRQARDYDRADDDLYDRLPVLDYEVFGGVPRLFRGGNDPVDRFFDSALDRVPRFFQVIKKSLFLWLRRDSPRILLPELGVGGVHYACRAPVRRERIMQKRSQALLRRGYLFALFLVDLLDAAVDLLYRLLKLTDASVDRADLGFYSLKG